MRLTKSNIIKTLADKNLFIYDLCTQKGENVKIETVTYNKDLALYFINGEEIKLDLPAIKSLFCCGTAKTIRFTFMLQ